MEHLYRESLLWQQKATASFKRGLFDRVHWESRLIGITGARGTGKTTLLLQRMQELELPSHRMLYLPLDHLWFTENPLSRLIEDFRNKGGTHLFLDEVHKYPEWSRALKQAYELYPELHIVFSGSSVLDIREADADLSRRAVLYELPGLSFREFLLFKKLLKWDPIEWETLLSDHEAISLSIAERVRPLEHFPEYLSSGYYPFFQEDPETYPIRLRQVIDLVLGTDLRFVKGFDPGNARRIAQLLQILAMNVPFKPKVSKLAEHIGIYRNTLVQYLHYLERARLIDNLYHQERSTGSLRKPDKILLQNPNLAHALAPEKVETGSLRESFFHSQVSVVRQVGLTRSADFTVDQDIHFEVGGRNKDEKQIRDLEKAFLVTDDIETGAGRRIPLWLFGFLY